ncbi:hypothetical protein ACFFX1_02550 [Dactylosporangium sucinum]|uniref:Uncharacterized protein n=1 Tax=Dactylosporangium sucinum TaxID=1424081 RepID=A0A917T3A7_9ACTN|nr:hypothetical protein [Dactylosporangium sucinum]GGM07502.1 hypothetical protein GCM10007977_005690 [Dactylosporangium sucinum]
MRTKAWQCVAGVALAIGTLSAAQATGDPGPALAASALSSPVAAEQPSSTARDLPPRDDEQTVRLLTATGLLAFGGIVLVGGVVGLGGMRIPGGVAMTVGRTRHWARSVRSGRPVGAHRARR